MILSHFIVLILCGTASALRRPHNTNQIKPECGMEDYASGAWVAFAKTKKTYVCCGGDSGQLPGQYSFQPGGTFPSGSGGPEFCQTAEQQMVEGLERSYSGDGEPFKYVMNGRGACSCDSHPSTFDRVLDFEKYEWQPSLCQIKAFDANNFCSILKNRRLLFLGDSTAEQAGSTVMNMVRAGSTNGKGCSHDVQVRMTDTLGMPGDRVHDVDRKWITKNGWNNQVLERTFSENDVHFSEFGHMVADTMRLSTAEDIIILNAGPHFHSFEVYQNMLNSVAKSIQKKRNQPNAPVILWKTISGAGCGPEGSITGDSWLDSLEGKQYGWVNFKKYDAMAAHVMQSIVPPVPVINVSMLYQRGDAHPGSFDHGGGDCLHFCTPGPLDVIPRILEHIFSKVL